MDFDYSVARKIVHNGDIIVVLEVNRLSYLSVGDIVVQSPKKYLDLVKWFKENHRRLSSLVNIIIDYDLPMLTGTHSMMSRRIARLKKFIKILEFICVRADLSMILLHNLFTIEYEALKEIVDALKLVEEETHRPRDWVHQLIYPYLRRTLEQFMEKRMNV